MSALTTTAIVDGCARVIAGSLGLTDAHIFAAGVTTSVIAAAPLVVPFGDDFTEGGLPAVTCAMGAWHPALQPGNERYGRDNPFEILCAIWVPRVPLAENMELLYGYRDAIADAFIAHTKAFLTEPYLQAAILAGGPGIQERDRGDPTAPRMFLTLPFTVNVSINRPVVPQPA